ncbi:MULTISPECIES: dihydrodipicolinate synthase family protein [Natrialba]|uniref:Aldolase n=1 Tax=Natrialba swarupiae TaxID=2448032 RepID=A0A5D5ANJ9_9EURY|nr:MULTISPECIES: dihydrodipicolinate synthase family protein [Natrialba]MWV38445.1 aldolase [Natrialba sp. INN-245]TYT62583.1 aldolase [Natrialba swarupiae]
MGSQRLEYEDVEGIFSIMPTPATADASDPAAEYTLDREEAERGARQLADDGVDAIMINGTFGEAATLTEEEWKDFTRIVVEAVDGDVPVIAGPTTLNTRSTIRRMKYARDVGADGVLLGRPMWLELSPEATVEFHRHVAEAVPELGIIVYHNPPAFKNRLTPKLWEELAEIPQVVGAKYGAVDAGWRDAVSSVGDSVQLMPIERKWYIANELAPEHANAAWSGSASCDPLPALRLRDAITEGDDETARELNYRINKTNEKFYPQVGPEAVYPETMNVRHDDLYGLYTIPLQKARIEGAGYIDPGPVRPPYHVAPEELVEMARESGREWRQLASDLRDTDN